MRTKPAFFFLLLAGFLLAPVQTKADDPITDFFLGGLERKAKGVIDHAKEAGDFLAWRIGQEILTAIRAYKEATSELINQGSKEVNATLQKTFNEMEQTLDRIERGEEVIVNDAQRLTAQWSGIVKNIPFTNR